MFCLSTLLGALDHVWQNNCQEAKILIKGISYDFMEAILSSSIFMFFQSPEISLIKGSNHKHFLSKRSINNSRQSLLKKEKYRSPLNWFSREFPKAVPFFISWWHIINFHEMSWHILCLQMNAVCVDKRGSVDKYAAFAFKANLKSFCFLLIHTESNIFGLASNCFTFE